MADPSTAKYPPKIRAALAATDAAGISRRRSAPWTHRLFWRLGIPVRPPHFMGFFGYVIVGAVSFGGAGAAIYVREHQQIHDLAGFIHHMMPGLLGMAIFVAVSVAFRRRYGLPRWSELADDDTIAARFD
jgi:hypothetical protein